MKISRKLAQVMILVLAFFSVTGIQADGKIGVPASPDPLPEKWAEEFNKIRPDPHPEQLTRDTHYFVSDEQRHDLFKEAVSRNKGGIFVGLGTDQNYLMAGWCRPDVLVLMDFDQMIVDLHSVFRIIFLHAADHEEFLEMWSEEHTEEIRTLLKSAYPDPKFQRGVLKAYKRGRRFVERRLKRVKRSYGRRGVSTYLDNRDQYYYVANMFRAGRVFKVRGDLTAKNTVKDLAKAARKLGLAIRTLYLSNAEQYFKYRNDYRENMLALPFDDKSIVIRTAGTGEDTTPDGRYEYIVQSGENFQTWMRYPKAFNVWSLVRIKRKDPSTGLCYIEKLPPDKEKKK